MELRDFVKESLVQIVQGVAEAQSSLAGNNSLGSVSPEIRNSRSALESCGTLLREYENSFVQSKVELDTATRVESKYNFNSHLQGA